MDGEYLHGFVSADEDDGDGSPMNVSPSSQTARHLLGGGGLSSSSSSRLLIRGRGSSSSSSSLCSQSSTDSQSSMNSNVSHSSYTGSSTSSSARSRSVSRRRRRRRRSSTKSATGDGGGGGSGHSTFQNNSVREESAPTLTPRSAAHHGNDISKNHDETSRIASYWGCQRASNEEECGAQRMHRVSTRGLFSGGQLSSAGLSSRTGLSASSMDDDSASASSSTRKECEDESSTCKLLMESRSKERSNMSRSNKKKLGMNSVIRPVDMTTARRNEHSPKSGGGGTGTCSTACATAAGVLRHSTYMHGRNGRHQHQRKEDPGDNINTCNSSSSEEGEGSDTSSSSLSLRSQASGSTLSSLSVQSRSASRIPKTYRHNQSRLLSADPDSSSPSSSASTTTTEDEDTDAADGHPSKFERRGSLGHMTHHAVYHKQVDKGDGGYTSSSTLDSSPYYHDFHIPLPSTDSPHLSRTMFGGRAYTCTTNNNRATMYQQLQTTSRHMQRGWKPFLQTPSGHILTKPDYAAIDSEDRPLSRSGSFDAFSVSSLPTVHTTSISGNNGIGNGNASVASGSTRTTTCTADITVSDEVFTYYGSFRGFLAGLSRRFYYAPLCKLLRRPSFPHHVSPTTDQPPLVRDDTPPRQRLVRSIRNGAELLHITATYQWQRHSKLLVLSVMLMAVTYMLSYVSMHESNPQIQTGGNIGDEFSGTGGDRNDYSSPSSAGYQRKVAQLGLVDPNNPSISIPKEYQILMPSSMGGGASPATNVVRLGPLANIAYVTEPIRENDVPIFWHISRTGGSTLKHVMGQCLGMVISSDYGSKMNLLAEDHLRIVTADHGGKYVNCDTSTVAGIDMARSMGLVESNMAEVIVTQYLYQAASLFNTNQRGRLFTIFRDPIERAVSMFHYLQVASWEPTYDPLLSQISLLDYARSERVEHNWMTRVLSDTLDGPLTLNHLELAKAVIRQKTLVGLLEKKGETVERFKEAFGWQEKYPEFEKIVTEEERKLEMTRAEECADKLLHMDWPNKHRHPTVDDVQSQEYAQLYEVNRYDVEL